MLMTGTPEALEERAAEDLHVPREHDEVDVGEQAEHLLLGLGLALAAVGHVRERHAEALDVGARVRVVGDDDTGTRMSSSPLRIRHSRSSRQCSSRETRIPTRLTKSLGVSVNVMPNRSATSSKPVHRSFVLELHPQEEALAGVLGRGEDVRAVLEQEARDGGHDAGAVRARDDQPRAHARTLLGLQPGAPDADVDGQRRLARLPTARASRPRRARGPRRPRPRGPRRAARRAR
jgi:hypothetical protein